MGLACVALAVVSLVVPASLAFDAWAWLVWGRETLHLDLATTAGPAWKPLPVLVTTPQDVSVSDVRKAVGMFRQLNIPVLGVMENMSGFVCPDCGTEHDLFGSGGGAKIARELGLDVLGRVPIEPAVRSGGDAGVPITSAQHPSADTSAAAAALREVARVVAGRISVLAAPLPAAVAS